MISLALLLALVDWAKVFNDLWSWILCDNFSGRRVSREIWLQCWDPAVGSRSLSSVSEEVNKDSERERETETKRERQPRAVNRVTIDKATIKQILSCFLTQEISRRWFKIQNLMKMVVFAIYPWCIKAMLIYLKTMILKCLFVRLWVWSLVAHVLLDTFSHCSQFWLS